MLDWESNRIPVDAFASTGPAERVRPMQSTPAMLIVTSVNNNGRTNTNNTEKSAMVTNHGRGITTLQLLSPRVEHHRDTHRSAELRSIEFQQRP